MYRSSCPEVFCKKVLSEIFANLCQSLFLRPATLLKRRLWHRCFPVSFAKFLRASLFIEHLFEKFSKKFKGDLKMKLCGKRLYLNGSVKYIGVKIDTNLSWQYRVNDLSIKLNRANAHLCKIKILRFIYFAISDSYLSSCCLVLAQNCSTIQSIKILQQKAITISNFQPRIFHTSPLFKQNSFKISR